MKYLAVIAALFAAPATAAEFTSVKADGAVADAAEDSE